jgi:FkbM family methyltransferase
MKISWLSNAPWCRTGYGNQTLLFVPRIRNLGHGMAVTAFYGLEGGILDWNGIPVYGRGYHPYGMDIAAANAVHQSADILLTLIDAWVMEPGMMLPGTRWVPWFPVDHETLPPAVRDKVQAAFARIVYSRFGEQAVKDAGMDCYYIPHGVDCSVFAPRDRAKAREFLGWPADRFIVGMVAANKGNPSRKSFTQQIEAFARFKAKHPNSMMYIHTVAGTENAGVDLPTFVGALGMTAGFKGRCNPAEVDVLFCDQYQGHLGFPDEYMVAVYNGIDVLLSVSMGEGFGIPILEAQACGCPVIVGDWTSMPELCFAGWKIAKSDAERFWSPLNAYQYIPHVEPIVSKLEIAYRKRGDTYLRDKARAGALPYDVDTVTEQYWRPVLADIEERINRWKPQPEHQHEWIQTGLWNADGTLSVPCKTCGAELRLPMEHGQQQAVIEGGFTNPDELKFTEPDGLEWLLMREVERDYSLDLKELNADSVIVDIGAHVGVVSMTLAKRYGCKVWAYEPNSENFRRLVENVQKNGLGNLIGCYNFAVTGDGRIVKISTNPQNSGGGHIYGDGEEVPSLTLADILEDVGGHIDLLKIDCEGAEYEILEGAGELLGKIGAIRGEFHPMEGKSQTALLEMVRAAVPNTRVTLLGLPAAEVVDAN